VGVLRTLGRLFGRRRSPDERARRLEASGRLEDATLAYLDAGERAEAARLYVLRADAVSDPLARLRLLGQAKNFADGQPADDIARRRARLAIDLVRTGSLTLLSSELSELGRELERLGEPAAAADAHARAGDVDAEARALVAAGEIEQLEQVLDAQQDRVREGRQRDALHQRILDLKLAGRRRDALAAISAEGRADERVKAVATEIETRRAQGPRVRLEIDGEITDVVFGQRIVVGRSGADLVVPSPSVSREHLSVRIGPNGPEVIDEGSRNGTLLGGVRIDVPISVGEGLELMLGGEVPLTVKPWHGGVRLEIGGQSLLAPLGPLPVAGWTLAVADDGWLELDAGAAPALLGGLRLDREIQLCRGDELREAVDSPIRLKVIG
jgi:hypothetical protein